ncbi:hypothetical protein GpartN1_g5852.t1 [Galdieria partita]|uniref:Mitochondrial phosphate carrier protein n=1 Tax=Galdieria partita TaxID=83374 RepID=A0A9C7Q0M0_9RHOD|nr:hypothetical protein GpartN1_g5852.t1 [Galdieria partita]
MASLPSVHFLSQLQSVNPVFNSFSKDTKTAAGFPGSVSYSFGVSDQHKKVNQGLLASSPTESRVPSFVFPHLVAPSISEDGITLYLKYALGGAICCSVTHSSTVPIDVVKTRLQTDPGRYKGMIDGFRTIVKEEGASMLLQGLGPTAVGYFLQGTFKFGFYEFFKKYFSELAGPENAVTFRFPIWLTAGACAEFIADLFLCPLEATRIRLVAEPSFAKGLTDGFMKLAKEEGFMGLYKGLGPILFKQVPYTMAKFSVFETAQEVIYRTLRNIGYPRESMSEGMQLVVSLNSGVLAGLAAAIVSQPADTVLSKINQVKTEGSTAKAIVTIMKQLGFRKLFLGTGPRCLMVGWLTAGQFFIYDYVKQLLGIFPTQQSAPKPIAAKV